MTKESKIALVIFSLCFLAVCYFTNPNVEDFIKYAIYRQDNPHPLAFPSSIEYKNRYFFSTYGYKGFHKSGSFIGVCGNVFHTGGSSIENIDYEMVEMDSFVKGLPQYYSPTKSK